MMETMLQLGSFKWINTTERTGFTSNRKTIYTLEPIQSNSTPFYWKFSFYSFYQDDNRSTLRFPPQPDVSAIQSFGMAVTTLGARAWWAIPRMDRSITCRRTDLQASFIYLYFYSNTFKSASQILKWASYVFVWSSFPYSVSNLYIAMARLIANCLSEEFRWRYGCPYVGHTSFYYFSRKNSVVTSAVLITK